MLAKLADKSTDVKSYQNAFVCIGRELGSVLKSMLPDNYKTAALLACASEDADWLATGMMEGLDAPKMPLAVFWSKRYTLNSGVDISPITMSYQDDLSEECKALIIVKSIISSSCVVKTQILRLISTLSPDRIFIVAPVMYRDAKANLSKDFPKEISDKFEFVTFAEDDEIKGREIIPGIGGMVYERLGLIDNNAKNHYMPHIVSSRMALL